MSLSKIQSRLKANKSQFNKFGNYNYRSLEDITEALKPLLEEFNAHFIINHEPFELGGRLFDKATAKITFAGDKDNNDISHEATAYAEMLIGAKGMSQPQQSGATQTYSGKYATAGLFAIDDNKDPDSLDNSTNNRPTGSKATEDDKKRAWHDFTELCSSKSVDPVNFISSQVDMSDKKAVHNLVVKWLKNTDALLGQLDNFEG